MPNRIARGRRRVRAGAVVVALSTLAALSVPVRGSCVRAPTAARRLRAGGRARTRRRQSRSRGSSLLVSPTPDGGPTDDGLLEASEIVNLNLDAELIVLSACNTGGGGGEGGGESLSGLARAFFYAGARSLLVSHWAVDSFATVDLMSGAFEGLAAQGVTTAEALRLSQLTMIRGGDYSHPYYWGAFTVVGDGGRQLPIS